jgi:hypothetical protein
VRDFDYLRATLTFAPKRRNAARIGASMIGISGSISCIREHRSDVINYDRIDRIGRIATTIVPIQLVLRVEKNADTDVGSSAVQDGARAILKHHIEA